MTDPNGELQHERQRVNSAGERHPSRQPYVTERGWRDLHPRNWPDVHDDRLEVSAMKMETVSRQIRHGVCAALVLVGAGASYAQAQGNHDHGGPASSQQQTAEQKRRASALVQEIRDLTAGFQTPDTLPEGYNLILGALIGGDFAAI